MLFIATIESLLGSVWACAACGLAGLVFGWLVSPSALARLFGRNR